MIACLLIVLAAVVLATASAAVTHDDYVSLFNRLHTNPVDDDERALVDKVFKHLSEQIEPVALRIHEMNANDGPEWTYSNDVICTAFLAFVRESDHDEEVEESVQVGNFEGTKVTIFKETELNDIFYKIACRIRELLSLETEDEEDS